MDLRNVSNKELLQNTLTLVESERRIGIEILHHLAEIDRRRAFAELGYPSLWDYTIRELKYSESAAYRRISAMRALKENPALEPRIRAGAISVSVVSQVQTFIRAERNQAHRSYSKEQKQDLFRRCENKSSREVTRELLNVSPLAIRVQKERLLTDNRTMISFVADEALLGKIHRVRDLSVAKMRDPASYPELVDLMSEVTLDKIDPARKPDKNLVPITSQPTDSLKQSRAVPETVRRRVWIKCGGRCTYVEPASGRRCNSTFGLEIDHCKPYGLGGSSHDPANLRLLCRKHNQLQAIRTYGLSKMEPFLKES